MSNIWDEFERDNREGNHNFLIEEVGYGHFNNGNEFVEFKGSLVTADGASMKKTFGQHPSDAELQAELAAVKAKKPSPNGWTDGQRRGIASTGRMLDALKGTYKKAVITHEPTEADALPDGLSYLGAGDTIGVKVEKRKGFHEVIAIIPLVKSVASVPSGGDDIPF